MKVAPYAKLFVLQTFFVLSCAVGLTASDSTVNVTVNWDKVVGDWKTTATLQVAVNPLLRRGSPIHDRVFQALRDLQCDYVRHLSWHTYPKLAVAELDPPLNGKTSWDFSLIDPLTIDFLEATRGHSVTLDFSTIPQWMFKTEKPVPYPADPDEVTFNYMQGTEPRDPSLNEMADYYARLVSWYTQGGFKDEQGQWHKSDHHYKIDYYEVLNEVDVEHQMTPETYTRVYDAVVQAIRRVAPKMKFVGLSLAWPSKHPEFFEYFLNPKNHQPGIPLDMISYHFYAIPTRDQDPYAHQFTFFEQADHFLDTVRYVDSIRQRLSPETKTTLNELGAILPRSNLVPYRPIPNSYWNLSGAMFAYLYAELARLGIDVAGQSQLVGYPAQSASVSMVDWNTGQPNARYWVLKLLRDHFGPGDKLVDTRVSGPSVYARGVLTRDGKRKILLINKRDPPVEVSLPSSAGAQVDFVDQTTGFNPPASVKSPVERLNLNGFAVAAVTLPK